MRDRRDAPRETIVAVASPPGRGVRAIVRASGAGVRDMARAVLDRPPAARGAACARARLASPPHGGPCASTPVVAAASFAPASFTGEDTIELSLAASPALVDALVEALVDAARAAGHAARLARPGEFAYRAHLAGRLGIDEAESVAARIAATGDAELDVARDIAGGEASRRASRLADDAASLLALVEAGIDFADEEGVVAVPAADVASRAAALARTAHALRGGEVAARSAPRPRIVLAGEPNAGKSTLFNALVGLARAVASPVEGTTRDAVVAAIAPGGGIEADLVDLAGLAADAVVAPPGAVEARMRATALAAIASADLVLRCTPPGRSPLPLETRAAIVEIHTMSDRAVAAADGAGGWDPASAASAHADRDSGTPFATIATSARTGEGIDRLRAAIVRAIRADRAQRHAQLAAVLPRRDAAFRSAAEAFEEAARLAGRARGSTLDEPEIVASLLRAALDRLGEVSGEIHPDDVLGLVFSRFCIGK